MKINCVSTPFLGVGILLLSAWGSGGLAGCQSKKEMPDPCQGMKANPLTIQFTEGFGAPTPDTAYNDQPVAFSGPGAPYTSYKWLIGTADQRQGQRVAVRFDNKTFGPVPVRLIATRPPNTACFKNDDGVDTLTKVLTLVPFRDLRAPIYGKFRGANQDTPQDTFTVHIYAGPNYYQPQNPAAEYTNYAMGIPKGCRTPYHEIGLTWRGIVGSSGGCSGFDISKGYLTTRDSIRILYRTQVAPTIVDKVFLGKRVR